MMGGTVSFLTERLKPLFDLGLVGRLVGLFLVMFVGLAMYSFIIYILKIPEFQELISQVRRFRRKT
jgi:hypothetical protein